MTATPVALYWSGGKDSALALEQLRNDERYEVRWLLTLSDDARKVSSVHEVPMHLLQAQADAIGLPLRPVPLGDPGLGDLMAAMTHSARELLADDIDAVAFGDLDHSGALTHRAALFEPLGFTVLMPLRGMTTEHCIDEILRLSIDAVVVTVDAAVLAQEHVGRPVNRAFVEEVRSRGLDLCGESGEYHSLVTNAPSFRHPVACEAVGIDRLDRQIATSDGQQTFGYWQLRLR